MSLSLKSELDAMAVKSCWSSGNDRSAAKCQNRSPGQPSRAGRHGQTVEATSEQHGSALSMMP